tara:strand:- start:367 stop:1044 length:678 start_codon:yes stop_codon:yes gene_type:complete
MIEPTDFLHNLMAGAATQLIAERVVDPAPDPGWLLQLQESARPVVTSGGTFLIATVLVLICLGAWLLNLIALPGNWLAVLAMGVYAWLGPESGRGQLGLVPLGLAFLAAILGEIVEFAAGAVGASRAGASRRGTIMAIGGSMMGAIAGGIIGLPIPVIGPVLAALLFGGLGATAGAMLAEWQDGKPWRENWRIGHAAFWGRTTGTVGKMLIGILIVLICLIAVLI